MTADYDWVAETMAKTVPWVGTAGIEFLELEAERVVCALRDTPEQRNHVGGPHAAVMFGLAETASGAVTLAAFTPLLERAVPLVTSSEIHYEKLALGDLTTEAVLGGDVEEVTAELDEGGRPEFPVHCTIRDSAGNTTGRMTVRWTLRPARS
ncbi:acyl-coenzyme A thioesterase PaaI-like protein [Actinopolyspora biskrensis]|uniref:Acyl-coenzyme A thioesterase PaaI-like protein n=1 Tax=Actinopolyspora biskrensis TaxID=1470178 RepID=A0A852Z1Q5_9ACTN|nr:DUF4442 domain-containing protein [Actinopolyspora biskrensis]NYH79205.1 acyl-coenzyme A thioesterase PaaI-like protein [Actinopolyspora biskrensis]